MANETSPEIEIIDLASGTVARTIPLGGMAFGLMPTPDGSQLYFTLSSSGEIGIIDRASETVLNRLQAGGTARRIAFDPSGTTAYVSNEQGWVDVVQ